MALVLALRLHGADSQESLQCDPSEPQAPGYVSKRHRQATAYVPSGQPLRLMAGPMEQWPPQQESWPAPWAQPAGHPNRSPGPWNSSHPNRSPGHPNWSHGHPNRSHGHPNTSPGHPNRSGPPMATPTGVSDSIITGQPLDFCPDSWPAR